MNIWIKSLLIGLGVAALTFFVSRQLGNGNKPLYAIQYTIQIIPDEKAREGEKVDAMLAIPQVLKRRCDAAGYSIDIKGSSNNQLEIGLTHVRDTLQAADLMTTNNKLEFRELYMISELTNSFSSAFNASKKFFPGSNTGDSSNAFDTKNMSSVIFFSMDQGGTLVNNGTIGRVLKKDTALVNRILADPEIFKSFPPDVEFLYGPVESTAGAMDKQTLFTLYAIKTRMEKSPLKNIDIMTARADRNINGDPEVLFQFSGAGARIWERMTMQNKGRNIAIILNKEVRSAPHVNEAISGGNCSISGGFSWEEAELLADQLNAGYIPVDLSIIQKHISREKPASAGKNMLMPAIMFLLAAGLSFLIFNSLKRK